MASSSCLSKANTSFCLDMSTKLSEHDKTANIFYSPFSISSALAMVMLGTRGNTATQMSEVLHFNEAQQPNEEEDQQQKQAGMPSAMQSQMQTRMQMRTQIQQSSRLPQYLLKCLKPQDCQEMDGIHVHFAQLLNMFNKSDAPYSLSVASRLYGEKSYQFIEDFLAKSKKHYKAELESVDFKTHAEQARVNINGWVEKQTQGKIKDILAQGVVDSMTRLVLVNAIYFKGKWNKQFDEKCTVDAQFRINKNDTKSVKMMCQTGKFRLASIPDAACQILEMPYKGQELSMIIFLPSEIEDDTTGLEKLEKELTYEKFVEWTHPAKMQQTEVEVNFPRFKMETKYDLNEVLKSMGMVDVFDDSKCDLSGMSPANDLALSKVVHRAYVEVNEEGTEAAAATAVTITACALIIPATFIADHPFLFFIRHNPTKSVLFAGRYCSPEHHHQVSLQSIEVHIQGVKSLRILLGGECGSFRAQVSDNKMASSTPLSKANTSFSLALFKKLDQHDKTANIFYSPFSISSALAMVMLGSRGDTATQMSECLKTQDCHDDVHASFAQLLNELNKPDAPYSLNVANRLYGEKSYQFVEDFLVKTRKYYAAELEPVDFKNSSEAARVNINNWVEKRHKDVLVKGVVDNMTRMVLVNAIYFKGNWNKQFQETATRDAQFRINKNETKPVKMMHQKSKFPFTYISEASCQILEMPYKGKELSMLIFLPTNIDDNSMGLEKLEKELTYENFVEWTRPDMMNEVEVQVGLPRFKMEVKYDMKNVLVSMGMVDAFNQAKSDFSGMSPANDLFLSKVVHKAFVEVNEEGTEAAAATAAIMMLRCAFPTTTFIADHPFLFVIRHNATMSVLFVGRYCSPQ
ncbi:hypothetical protein Q5P01_003257 [Channa striata]|uniref:Leukocyte elastase inhibitor n=1 Tax=Channa striata TaxID=64152 RepID=A0AA88NHH5_CHASR|nr:hypothetical protein Q5P01_003257 [Channa striata]